MLVIALDACIDCGMCDPDSPGDAMIKSDSHKLGQRWLELNAQFSAR